MLSRARWPSLVLSRILLGLLVMTFVAAGIPVLLGICTIERRWGRKNSGAGHLSRPRASHKEFFVRTSGLRWVSLQLLLPIPWPDQVWALPFLTILALLRATINNRANATRP